MFNLDDFSEIINKAVFGVEMPVAPANLYEPIRYTLSSGGKRVRPLITLSSCYMFSDEVSAALPAAVAIEVFHNFTLLHDDIMDKADVRRGRDTVHRKWNENVAILSGDAMTILSYKILAKSEGNTIKKLIEVFNSTALGVCEGQQFDMEFEGRNNVTVDEYMKMIELKTSVMIGGAAQLGAVAAGADDTDAAKLYRFGVELGLAFQLQDDLLDTYGDPATFGKSIGGDIASNKKTLLLIKAKELTDDKTAFEGLLCRTDNKFEAVKAVYDRTGVRKLAETEIARHYENAMNILSDIKVSESRKEPLREITRRLLKRDK